MDAHCWLGRVYVGSAVDMARASHAVAVTDFEAAYTQTITYFDIAPSTTFAKCNVSALLKPLKGHETNAAIFVGKIGPYNVVEDVSLDGVDCEWQCG